MSYISLTYIM